MNIQSVAFHPLDRSLLPADLSTLPRAPKRIMQVLTKGSSTTSDSAPRSWSLDFKLCPTSFQSSPLDADQLGSMSFERTVLKPDDFDLGASASGSGETVSMSTSMAFRSIGYKSEAIEGMNDIGVPFNDRNGTVPNDYFGRVLSPAQGPGSLTAGHVPGMYCAGWVKRGPTGVIASTMSDAFSTADAIVEDWQSHALFLNTHANGSRQTCLGWDGIKAEAEKRGCRRVSWQDWQKIDRAERLRGERNGKEREKFTRVEDMLAVLD